MSGFLLHILIAVHTLIAAISTGALFYLLYAALKGHSPAKDPILLFALVWPLANLVILAANGWTCPMQNWAQDLTGQHAGWVRDIYWIPERWLRIVPWTYSLGYLAGVLLVFARLAWSRARAGDVRQRD
ncbi:MAG: hypothetical protein KGJ78_05200 [Alphaproteobacteria bacterium]|nr:hypothetical protein [Alphaproteobacteria bacterium]